MDALSLHFVNPIFLNLLVIPAAIFLVWVARLISRRLSVRDYLRKREVPIKEKYLFTGPMLFWLYLIVSVAFLIIALARPQKVISITNKNSVDLVIIQDGSASMYVKDVKPDRWGRSISWIRTLVETLAWKGDRIALASFAHSASPMIRLTTDPNVVMFFLEHLKKSPFLLYEDIAWDTNMEEGIYWGAKILLKDEKLNGLSKNPRAFIVISDGQVWSGKMQEMFKLIKNLGPVFVVGVGTSSGGDIPQPDIFEQTSTVDESEVTVYGTKRITPPSIHSSLDRQSLKNIAITGGGEYFELGTQSDIVIAAKIINDVQRHKSYENKEESLQDLYWYCLLGVLIFLVFGVYVLFR